MDTLFLRILQLRHACSSVTVAALLLLLNISTATAEFGGSFLLGAPSTDFAGPLVDAAGTARVVWGQAGPMKSRILSRTVGLDGSLGPIQTIVEVPLTAGRVGSPSFAVAPNGDAAIAWVRDSKASGKRSIQMRFLSAAGNLSAPQVIYVDTADTQMKPSVGLDAAGTSWVVSVNEAPDALYVVKLSIIARRRSSAGLLGPTRELGGARGTGSSATASISIAPNGYGIILVETVDQAEAESIANSFARTASPNGSLGPNLFFGYDFHIPIFREVTLDPAGNAVVYYYDINDYGDESILARAILAGGGRGRVQRIVSGDFMLRAGLAADGHSLLLWSNQQSYDLDYQFHIRTRAPTGELGPIRDLDFRGWSPVFRVFPDGSALVVWRDYDPQGDIRQLRARVISAAGEPGPVQILSYSNTAFSGSTGFGAVVDARGRALVVWADENNQLRAAVGP